MMMQGVGNIIDDYGAAGNGTANDSPAFDAWLRSAEDVCYLPPGKTFAIDKTLQIPAGKSVWCPGGGLATIQVRFAGLAIEMHGSHPGLHGVKLYPADANEGKYDGVGFYRTDHATLHDVWIYYPKTGLRLLRGECDWGDIQVAIKWFYLTGIDFRSFHAPVRSGEAWESGRTYSNNNTIRILEEIHGRPSEYFSVDKDGKVTTPLKEPEAKLGRREKRKWSSGDTYGIRMHGTVNTIIGGEITLAKYAIDDQGDQNRWIGQYVEQCRSIKVGPKAHYFDCHLALDIPPIIDPESIVFGQSGLTYSRYCHFERPQASASNLTGLWYFDKIVSGVILDHSGHGNHLEVTGSAAFLRSPSFRESPYGKGLVQDSTRKTPTGTPTIPRAACDWSKPFTMVVCFQVKRIDGNNILISWDRPGGYTRITAAPGSPHLQYSEAPNTKESVWSELGWGSEVFSPHDHPAHTQKWCWLGMFIDPVKGKAKLLDSWATDTKPQRLSIEGGLKQPAKVSLFNTDGIGAPGAVCFLAFWQREMMLPEFIALINQRTHWQPTPRPTVAMKRIELIADDGKGHRICYRSQPPLNGQKGDIVFNSDPQVFGKVGWICVEASSPAIWMPFGTIAP